jgi:hypothetical protein
MYAYIKWDLLFTIHFHWLTQVHLVSGEVRIEI